MIKLAVCYPPDYTPPPASKQLQPEVLRTFLLTRVDNANQWDAEISSLQKSGVYRFRVHAEDDAGLVASTVHLDININGNQIYLPLISR